LRPDVKPLGKDGAITRHNDQPRVKELRGREIAEMAKIIGLTTFGDQLAATKQQYQDMT